MGCWVWCGGDELLDIADSPVLVRWGGVGGGGQGGWETRVLPVTVEFSVNANE